MTADVAPAPVRYQARAVSPVSVWRLLWLELRRNSMPLVLPLIAAVVWFDSYRLVPTLPPVWNIRTFYYLGQAHTLIDFGPFVAGVAAWMGSRDGRRGMGDLVTATSRPRWVAQLVTWAATACWAVGAYAVFMGALIWATGRGIPWGGPPWWPVVVGAVGVAAFSAAGFAVGAFYPSRFAAPVAAFGAFILLAVSSNIGFSEPSPWALILPSNSNANFGQDSGIFYPYLPGLPMARVMFLAGAALALVGLLGLPASAGSWRLRRTAGAVTAVGAAAAVTAVVLTATATVGPYGAVVPVLNDVASEQPIPYTPVCGSAGIPVCVHPAYKPFLADVTAALRPVLSQVSGLPGAPVRATQIATVFANGTLSGGTVVRFQPTGVGQIAVLSGSPAVLYLPLGAQALPGSFGADKIQYADEERLQFVHAFFVGGTPQGDQAQLAVQAAVLQVSGIPLAQQPSRVWGYSPWPLLGGRNPSAARYPAPVLAAATRFAGLSGPARHAWLASHLAALRAGQITLGQLP
jgi:hypothetical protein